METTPTHGLHELRALELELQHPHARGDRSRLEALLHADFMEFGRSGRCYDKATLVDYLSHEGAHAQVQSSDFAVRLLADDVALLTYRSAQVHADGRLRRHTLRASIWKRTKEGWQMIFHQGTPTEPFEPLSSTRTP